jgi:hypothetical protein
MQGQVIGSGRILGACPSLFYISSSEILSLPELWLAHEGRV